jgi:hypothetical protein
MNVSMTCFCTAYWANVYFLPVQKLIYIYFICIVIHEAPFQALVCARVCLVKWVRPPISKEVYVHVLNTVSFH